MKRALLAAVLAALATGAVLATVGFGASSTSSESRGARSSAAGPPPTMAQALAEGRERQAAQQARLAKAIGVSADKLRSALDELQRERLDADVAASRLTEAQRTAVLACRQAPLTCDRSNLPAGRFGGPHGERPGKAGITATLAKKLGVSEQKVKRALAKAMPARGDKRGHWRDRGHRPGMGGPAMGAIDGAPGMGGPGAGRPGMGGWQ